jgi:hypothetical protein
VENLNVSTRQGCNFPLRQVRATEAKQTPNAAASSRADQCVTPSRAGGRPSSARVATTTPISSISGGRPLRGRFPNAEIPPFS